MTDTSGVEITDAQIDAAIDRHIVDDPGVITPLSVLCLLNPDLTPDLGFSFIGLDERIRGRLDAHPRLDGQVWVVR